NSAGKQDLIVHIIARKQRYDVANFDNVVIPTNLDVGDPVRHQFPSFYAALFEHTLAARPHSVVTEYAWAAGTCDPCPSPPLNNLDLLTLGADVIPSGSNQGSQPLDPSGEFVITRLHTRYEKSSLGQDLVFRAAPPISGGRENRGKKGAKLETGAV